MLLLQEQAAQQMGKQAVTNFLRTEDIRGCNTLREFLDRDIEISPVTRKELEKYMALCDLFKALNDIANNEPGQFQVAEKIINTQVGRGAQYL